MVEPKAVKLSQRKNKLLAAALKYAALGWRTFPVLAVSQTGGCECGDNNCDRSGKHPAIKGWPKEATTDEAKIKAWWSEHPDRGIGIATGEGSNLTVLDVDGDEGVETLTKLAGSGGMPMTPCVSTRPGRYHYYFNFNPTIKSQAGKLGPKLDTRSDGGYVVAPPSRHASGGLYEWVRDPSKGPVVDWPEFLSGKPKGEAKRGRPEHERFNPDNPHDVEMIQSALAFINADDEEKWGQIGWAMGRAFQQSDAGFAIYSAWAGSSRKHDRKRTREHYYESSKKPAPHYLTTKKIYAWAVEEGWAPPSDGRALIMLQDGELSLTVDATVAVLASAHGIYARNSELIRVVSVREAKAMGLQLAGEKDIRRDESMPTIVPFDVDYLRYRLSKLARFQLVNRVNCPKDIAQTILRLGEWDNIPPLHAIASAPFLRSDGTICDQVGYDAATGVLLAPNDAILPVPERPSKKEAQAALAVLRAPFDEMPWKGPEHEAAYLAFIFTLVTRPILPKVPAAIFSAPMSSSGKTLLLECAAQLVYGIIPSTRSYPADKDEQRKVLQAVLLAGDLLIHFDNVAEGSLIGGSTLNGYLTATATGDRTLGHSVAPRMTNSTCFSFTGNNISAQREFARRALLIGIDANTARPDQRKFKIPKLNAYVREHRPELLCAVLTILRAFIVAGAPRPKRDEQVASFEDWDDLVLGCVEWIGMADPLKTQEELRDDDMEAASLDEILFKLSSINPDGSSFQTRDVISLTNRDGEMNTMMRDICAGGIVTPKGIGEWLSANRGKVSTDGKMKLIAEKGATDGRRRWRIKHASVGKSG